MSTRPPTPLLEIEAFAVRTVALGAPARAHRADFAANARRIARRRQERVAHAREARSERRIAGDRAGTNERLQFPGPCAFAKIRLVRVDAEHEQTLAAVGPEAHVDFVELSGARLHVEQMHDALRETREVARAVERPSAVGLVLRECAVVEEYEIEIRTETELGTAEAAVRDYGESGRIRTAGRQAPVRGDEIALGNPQDRRQHDFGDAGECAGRGRRVDAPAKKCEADAEQCGLARFLDQLDFGFGIRTVERRETALQLGRDRIAIRRRGVDAIVEKIVEQERMRDHAIGEERARRQHFAQPLQRGGLLVEQDEIHRTARYGLHEAQHAHHATHRLGLAAADAMRTGSTRSQPFARARRHVAQRARAEQRFEFRGDIAGRRESGCRKRGTIDTFADDCAPERGPRRVVALHAARARRWPSAPRIPR